jgi:hypothetical protein
MTPLTTTLRRIEARRPCKNRWLHGLKAANKTEADDDPILFSEIAVTVGINDALWCCRAESQHSEQWRLFADWCGHGFGLMVPAHLPLAAAQKAQMTAQLAADHLPDWDATRVALDAVLAAQTKAFVQLCTDGTLPAN